MNLKRNARTSFRLPSCRVLILPWAKINAPKSDSKQAFLKKKSIEQYSTFESVTAAKKELKPRDALVGLWECVFPRSTCKKLIIIEGSTIN